LASGTAQHGLPSGGQFLEQIRGYRETVNLREGSRIMACSLPVPLVREKLLNGCSDRFSAHVLRVEDLRNAAALAQFSHIELLATQRD
jgi:hypothetical protein